MHCKVYATVRAQHSPYMSRLHEQNTACVHHNTATHSHCLHASAVLGYVNTIRRVHHLPLVVCYHCCTCDVHCCEVCDQCWRCCPPQASRGFAADRQSVQVRSHAREVKIHEVICASKLASYIVSEPSQPAALLSQVGQSRLKRVSKTAAQALHHLQRATVLTLRSNLL